jgi:hypothetical protein
MDLRSLEIAWPETPEFRFELAPRRRARRPLAVAVVVALAAVAAAFAVPQSRGAILRFFDIGGVTIVRVDRLPPAEERPLGAGLGPVVTPAVAAQELGHALLLPDLDPPPPLHLANRIVSFVFRYRGEPVLVSEFAFGHDAAVLKKVAGLATRIEPVPSGVWLEGAAHVYVVPNAPPRLAGNVLLLQRGDVTLRVEGKVLTKADALGLARGIR